MDSKTESYIVLKPIAERFSRIASEITDDEIKNLIKNEMKEQLRNYDFFDTVKIAVEEIMEDEDFYVKINKMFIQSIEQRFK